MNGFLGDYYVDVVFCVDATGRMAPAFDAVKNCLLSFYDKFIDRVKEIDKEVAQCRVKIIAFRDYGYDDEPMIESEFFNLPTQNERFKAFVCGIEAKGGVRGANALEAIALALKSDWTTGGAKRRHFVFVFSNSKTFALGDRVDATSYPFGMPKKIAELGSWWEGNDQMLGSTYQPKAGRLVAFVPHAEPWADLQAWNRYWPAFIPAESGGADFTSAFDDLLSSL